MDAKNVRAELNFNKRHKPCIPATAMTDIKGATVSKLRVSPKDLKSPNFQKIVCVTITLAVPERINIGIKLSLNFFLSCIKIGIVIVAQPIQKNTIAGIPITWRKALI